MFNAFGSTSTAGEIQRSNTRRIQAEKDGNFVMPFDVSDNILNKAEFKEGLEFTQTTYTAVTCEPEAFPKYYNLRAQLLNRPIKVALVITMYNENADLFTKSMMAVQKNIAYLCSTECPFGWGTDGWKHFSVVIVSDGLAKISEEVLQVLTVLGVFVPGLPRTSVNGKPVTAHIFEFTTQVAVDRSFQNYDKSDGIVPMQVTFLLKEKNAKKINSHRWFFNAVCAKINPEVTMLLDVGTKPSRNAFFHLYRAFERDPMVGGACGEIKAELGGWGKKALLNPLVAAQNFEYKMSNILDKPLESVFGYITVLPGAFSAYRYSALLGRPLEQYFLGEKLEETGDMFQSNMYLAEDRILCFELVTKPREPWILKYVKSARAETDVPETLDELISQRRRWLNGSFFAAVHALANFRQIYSSPHSQNQKILFTIEFIYNAINLAFTWFSLANFYLTFYFLFDVRHGKAGVTPFGQSADWVFEILRSVYMLAVFTMFIAALGNKPKASKNLYLFTSVLFAGIMIMMLYVGVWSIIAQINASNGRTFLAYFGESPAFRDLVISVLSTYGLYIGSSLFHLDPWHCFTCLVQYLLLLPTYNNIFMIYAFCNLHDVTWGTKGATEKEPEDSKPVEAKTNSEGKLIFEVEVATERDEINQTWTNATNELKLIKDKSSKPVKQNSANTITDKTKEQTEDDCKEFRTKVVLGWIFCNLALVAIFANSYMTDILAPKTEEAIKISPYLSFIFWSVAILSFVRFVGSVAFIFQWWGEKGADAGHRVIKGHKNNV